MAEPWATLPLVRHWLVIVAVVCGAGLGLTTTEASALKTRVNVREECTSKLLPGNGVVLTTTLTIRNAPRG